MKHNNLTTSEEKEWIAMRESLGLPGLPNKYIAEKKVLELAGVMSKFIIVGDTSVEGQIDPAKKGVSTEPTTERDKRRSRAIRGTAVRYIPDCRNFKIKLGGWDKLAELF